MVGNLPGVKFFFLGQLGRRPIKPQRKTKESERERERNVRKRKGGKGLGKGGAKRHRKVLWDNVIRDAQDLLGEHDSQG